MPIYGYACAECGHTLDALQKISDDPLVDCPECKEAALRRQLSAPRFRLKGSGWYETDFKTDKQRNLAGDKEPGTPDTKDADTSKDKADKPAPKADASTKKPDTVTSKKSDSAA